MTSSDNVAHATHSLRQAPLEQPLLQVPEVHIQGALNAALADQMETANRKSDRLKLLHELRKPAHNPVAAGARGYTHALQQQQKQYADGGRGFRNAVKHRDVAPPAPAPVTMKKAKMQSPPLNVKQHQNRISVQRVDNVHPKQHNSPRS